MRPSIRNFLITLVSSILIFGLIAFFIVQMTASPSVSTSSSSDEEDQVISFDDKLSKAYPNALNVSGNSFSILLIGTDYHPSAYLTNEEYWNYNYLRSVGGIDPNDEKAGWKPQPADVNADALLLIRFDKENAECMITSIPSNTEVVYGGFSTTLGQLYGTIGAEGMCNRVFGLTSMPVDYYAVLSLENFSKVMDQLGTVEYEVPFDMQYKDKSQDLTIDLKAGQTKQDSSTAIQLLRYSGNGETARAQRIADFFSAVLSQKFTSDDGISIQSLYDTVVSDLETNFKESDLVERAALVNSLGKMTLRVLTFPGTTENYDGVEYFKPNQNDSYALYGRYKINYYSEESN